MGGCGRQPGPRRPLPPPRVASITGGRTEARPKGDAGVLPGLDQPNQFFEAVEPFLHLLLDVPDGLVHVLVPKLARPEEQDNMRGIYAISVAPVVARFDLKVKFGLLDRLDAESRAKRGGGRETAIGFGA